MVSLDYLLHFIREDTPLGDATADAVIPALACRAGIRAEEDGICAGIDEAATLFSHFGVTVESRTNDGCRVNRGDTLVTLSGQAKDILLVERTALNIIGRMSGVATQTKKMIDIVTGISPGCRVAGTRKTSPGFRALDKKAIIIGGGDPHRYSLSDGILIKDNHLALVPLAEAIVRAKKASAYKKVEVEVETLADALVAAKTGADILMLDNMSPEQIGETIAALKREGLRDRIVIELSGGITEKTIRHYAGLGADVISLGALTHSVRNFSVNLEIIPG
ncbi:MAG: carboxylating nicotinate-nucleotide diphosphorylase [Methanoregula sp.]|nr:carboxylating nicotinate-nucleotide diphosphorylase [Methanoregula sp.]